MNTYQAVDVYLDTSREDSGLVGGARVPAYLPETMVRELCEILGVKRVRNIAVRFGVGSDAELTPDRCDRLIRYLRDMTRTNHG
jgi:hypothetical protein